MHALRPDAVPGPQARGRKSVAALKLEEANGKTQKFKAVADIQASDDQELPPVNLYMLDGRSAAPRTEGAPLM